MPQEACVPYQESACRLHPWGQGSGATGAQRKARNERDKLHQKERVEKGNGSVLNGRDGREKGRPLSEKKEDGKEKRPERDKHYNVK